MLALQAGVVAAPRAAPSFPLAVRVRGPAWALVPIGSIVVVIFAIRFLSDTATGLTYLAVVAVPPLAAAALGWAARGARPPLALAAAGLFALAWAARASLVGEAAAALLSALSCVTLGVLLASVTPSGWLKVGIVAMAAADTWLVVSDLLQSPNATLIAAQPAGGLPRLQSELFGSVSMGYGDMFVAALLGAALAADRRHQWSAAALTLVLAALFDLLFFVVGELPATVPVALAMIGVELWARRGRTAAAGVAPNAQPAHSVRLLSAARYRSTRADATPRRAR